MVVVKSDFSSCDVWVSTNYTDISHNIQGTLPLQGHSILPSWTVQGRKCRPDNRSFSGHTECAVITQRRSRSENICKVCLFCSQDSEPTRLRRSLRDVQENVLRKYVNDISLHHELH